MCLGRACSILGSTTMVWVYLLSCCQIPVAIWKAGFGYLRHTVPPRDRLAWSWCPLVPYSSRKQGCSSPPLNWHGISLTTVGSEDYIMACPYLSDQCLLIISMQLFLISICCFVLFASRSSFCSALAQHLAWWHLVHEGGLLVLTYWK